MDDSPLAQLPAELRNRIWEYAMTTDGPVKLYHVLKAGYTFAKILRNCNSPRNSLLRTCKAIYHEAHQLLYATNDFTIHSRQDLDPQPVFQLFAATIGNANANALRKVDFVLWTHKPYPGRPAEAAMRFYLHIRATIEEAVKYPNCVFGLLIQSPRQTDWHCLPPPVPFHWSLRFRGKDGGFEQTVEKAAAEEGKSPRRAILQILAGMVREEFRES